jgi:P4 family phage/plasmid primase-like protien
VLAEWFGYVISGRLDLHKILLMVGPTRGGKGAIARILTALVGRANVAGPTLNSLGGEFGLAPLIGKSLAVISDARFVGKNSNIVVERLLSISGEDCLTVNRKYREQWTGKLPSRIHVISNELPKLGDASTAIVGRIVLLPLALSWLGKEDHSLEPSLHTELPGILNWSLDGLERLTENGNRFTRLSTAEEAIVTLRDLASPVAAFVRERCERGLGKEIVIDDLYSAYKGWCEDNGHAKSTKQTFGRDLRAVVPSVRSHRPRDGADRQRRYIGIALRMGDEPPPADDRDDLFEVGATLQKTADRVDQPPRPARSSSHGPHGPRSAAMYAAPTSRSDDLPYRGPPVEVPNLGPDDRDEHGKPLVNGRTAEPPPPDEDRALAELRAEAKRERDWPLPKGFMIDSGEGPQPHKRPPYPAHWKETYRRAWDRLSPQDQKTLADYMSEKFPTPEPGLSERRIRELAEQYQDRAHANYCETGDTRTSECDAWLRAILREEVDLPEHAEIEFKRIMQVVFAA